MLRIRKQCARTNRHASGGVETTHWLCAKEWVRSHQSQRQSILDRANAIREKSSPRAPTPAQKRMENWKSTEDVFIEDHSETEGSDDTDDQFADPVAAPEGSIVC